MTDTATETIEPSATNTEREESRTEIALRYASNSRVTASAGKTTLALFSNLHRDPVRFNGVIKDPLRFREAMGALYSVVGSDFRYVPKDRSAYVAYRRMKRETASLSAWQAQQQYFQWIMRNDPSAFLVLDPVITVHPNDVLFEVFSKDEGTYARLSIKHDAFDLDDEPVCGTTNIDFSESLYHGLQQMRRYRETRLGIGHDAVQVVTESAGEQLEKKIRLPDSWLRGFLQVQSAATLPRDSFTLAPIDIYNTLRHLRLHADRKGARRGLRVELVPGEFPILVLEPWEMVIATTAQKYQGRQAKVVRVWGRRRLSLMRRLLPLTESVDVHLLGSGLPSFWIFRAGELTMTLGLTGFTAANWSQAANFDVLLPRPSEETPEAQKVNRRLEKVWAEAESELARATKLQGAKLHEALQLGCQEGQLMFDLADDVFRYRKLTATPLDLVRMRYRNPRERVAHDLLARKGAVRIASENRIFGTGLELTGKVTVEEDKREYRPQMLISEDGFPSRAECTCTFFRKQGLKAGPCTHLVALRLAHSRQELNEKRKGKSRKTLTSETRTYSRRHPEGEDVVQISLDSRRIRLRWGPSGGVMRLQNLRFNSVDQARAEYLTRVDKLRDQGYLDASAG